MKMLYLNVVGVSMYEIVETFFFTFVYTFHRHTTEPTNTTSNFYPFSSSSFGFDSSTFDLLVLAGVRCIIILAASLLVLRRLALPACCLKASLFFGCAQVIYVVVKTVMYTTTTHRVPLRYWLLAGITLLSCCMFHYCLKTLNESSWHTDDSSELHNILTQDDDSTDKVDASTLCILGKLLLFARPDAVLIALALFFLVSSSLAQSMIPYYTGVVLNYIIADKSSDDFKNAIFCITSITLISSVSAGIRSGLFKFIFGRYKLRLQKSLFENVIHLDISFFDTSSTGEIMSRLSTDCTKIGDGLGLRLNIFIRSLVKVAGILYFMFLLSWNLSVITLTILPLFAIASDYFGSMYQDISAVVQDNLAHASSFAEEAISSIRTVRSFAGEKDEVVRYSKLLCVTSKNIKRQSVMVGLYRWCTELSSHFTLVVILYYGGHLVLTNRLSGGHLISFTFYSFELTNCIQDIGQVYTGIMEIIGTSRSVFNYISKQPKVNQGGYVVPRSGLDGNIEFRNVTFAYTSRENSPVLKNVSFSASKGEFVAVVGVSGSGKSSIINLLQHFYEPCKGEVLVDGVSVGNYEHTFLHQNVSLVQQEPVLFARTILENVTYGINPLPAQEDIENACISVNIHHFVCSLPQGYNTECGERAVMLSGGQKQRLAIARSLLRNPRILLLDEATSALDSESENLVQQAINKNLHGRTVVVVAHRLSTIEKADKILVMGEGKVVEQGTHAQLMQKDGVYAKLVQKQIFTLEKASQQAVG